MGKISLYDVIPTVASLSDLVIGTDVTNNNETVNFKLSQILELYSTMTEKASLTSTINQSATTINTPTTLSFNTKLINTASIIALPSVGPTYTSIQIGNAGTYLVQCAITITSSSTGQEVSGWLNVNGANVGSAYITTITGVGYNTLVMSWLYNFTQANTLSIIWQTSSLNSSLIAVGAGASRPNIPSARITISQV